MDPKTDGDGFCAVTVDHTLGGRLGVEHLLAARHRRIAFAGDPSAAPGCEQYRGAIQALQAAGGEPDDLMVLETQGQTIEDGHQAGERLARLRPAKRPTAVICENDGVSLGILRELWRSGLSVPDDVAVVGYGDPEAAEVASVTLTAVHPPREDLGRTAVALLLEELSGQSHHVHRKIALPPRLVSRASTAGRRLARVPQPRRASYGVRRRRPPGPPWLTAVL